MFISHAPLAQTLLEKHSISPPKYIVRLKTQLKVTSISSVSIIYLRNLATESDSYPNYASEEESLTSDLPDELRNRLKFEKALRTFYEKRGDSVDTVDDSFYYGGNHFTLWDLHKEAFRLKAYLHVSSTLLCQR